MPGRALLAWLLRDAATPGWGPPAGASPAETRDALAAALAGPPMEPDAPPAPLAALHRAAAAVDDRLLTLLELLGHRAVAEEPGLVLRLAGRLPQLPALADPRRRLLGLRLGPGDGGPAQGSGPGGEHAGVQRRGDPRSLLPSQLALPPAVLRARAARGELLYRARAGREPPRLRPAVILLDVSPPSFGPVEAVTRPAAHALAASLIEARVACWLVAAGGRGAALPLERPADLVELWARRSLEPARPARALAAARALAGGLGGGALEPAVVLLAESHFGAEEAAGVGAVRGLRALFVRHGGDGDPPAWSGRCERWAVLPAGRPEGLVSALGGLLA